MKKAVVIQGSSVEKLKELQKEYTDMYGRKLTFDFIVSKLILKAKANDLSK
ncbi:MAG: hypothetical protein ACO29X_06430 [Arcobacteraceae bacterium]|jgi:hypothetical protein